MSADNTTTATTPRPAPKPRNPVEKMIVRGFIGLMLVLVVIEAIPWYSHRQALAGLKQRLDAADQDTTSKGVYADDVKAVMGGRQPAAVEELEHDVNGATRREVYTWFTLSPFSKRQIYVYYGHASKHDKMGPEVLEAVPDEQRAGRVAPIELTPEEEEARKKNSEAMMGMGGPGGGGPGGGGPGGGRGKRQRPPAAHQEEPKSENGTDADEAKPTTEEPKEEKPAPEPAATGEEKVEAPAEKPAE